MSEVETDDDANDAADIPEDDTDAGGGVESAGYVPDEAEIKERCSEIRRKWSAAETLRREGIDPDKRGRRTERIARINIERPDK